ncbi:amidohydrolase family protein [Amycolatopsis sp. FU40]|uniref:amidohydrolase family protein n=1 Tax=Amycolatopsis sp. FU40 TaxID=2914159 RepID=UPI001F3A389B|nr:amidohydrolase family protein [Amycolatopsis sp. FU40]UKD56643.1 amidohydrolase family protein [Amycolatopsis sp. FU40]
MRIVTLEEHWTDPAVTAAGMPNLLKHVPGYAAAFDPDTGMPYPRRPDLLEDLGAARIADMDRHGITTQVLSLVNTFLPAEVAPELTAAANDTMAEAVAAFPGRFAAFAALPTAVPAAAADELRRCVGELGFVGTMIMGRTDDEFLDQPRFDPILRAASDLSVPIYLHPAPPPAAVSEASYAGGLSPAVSAAFRLPAWGWHQETAVHFLHLVLAGVLDRYPGLRFILGHWGELVPFYLDRLDETMPRRMTKLDRTFREYFRDNVFITPSGMFSQAQLRYCADTVGVDRILHSVDFPMLGNEGAVSFLTDSHLSREDQEKIAHGNADALLGLG